ncbi:unnamed protein product [Urochloa humidicola]
MRRKNEQREPGMELKVHVLCVLGVNGLARSSLPLNARMHRHSYSRRSRAKWYVSVPYEYSGSAHASTDIPRTLFKDRDWDPVFAVHASYVSGVPGVVLSSPQSR